MILKSITFSEWYFKDISMSLSRCKRVKQSKCCKSIKSNQCEILTGLRMELSSPSLLASSPLRTLRSLSIAKKKYVTRWDMVSTDWDKVWFQQHPSKFFRPNRLTTCWYGKRLQKQDSMSWEITGITCRSMSQQGFTCWWCVRRDYDCWLFSFVYKGTFFSLYHTSAYVLRTK